ncbi:MAG: glutamine-hydrolyzing carbamoyl-phosphate synthase small subunit [Simkania sp.]|nr:glutamine-hydrolyzing carbamoyl-phosphate synthase small subunit [Simkania sp.]
MDHDAVLALADGSVFYGESIGASGSFQGELVFNTSPTGYQEILTDPSYAGQIILFTAPHIGNVGINEEDWESDRIWAGGMITRFWSNHVSHWRSQRDLKGFLKDQGTVGISGIDTRALTHNLRNTGSQNACIIAGCIDPILATQRARQCLDLSNAHLTEQVTCKSMYFLSNESSVFHVIVVDFGVKRSILQQLLELGCRLTIVPASTPSELIVSLLPDGVILSNGPGDPARCRHIIHTIQELLHYEIPIFGICLGHQLLALASGAKTTKMPTGHHGANHPVIDVVTKRVSITSQNHHFVVSEEELPSCLKITHRSLFDGTIAGICRTDKPAFGFQGHPEASPGPHDLHELFKQFSRLMETSCAQKS